MPDIRGGRHRVCSSWDTDSAAVGSTADAEADAGADAGADADSSC